MNDGPQGTHAHVDGAAVHKHAALPRFTLMRGVTNCSKKSPSRSSDGQNLPPTPSATQRHPTRKAQALHMHPPQASKRAQDTRVEQIH